jgi:hypothetical protein
LVAVLDVDDEKADGQDDSERGNYAQCRVDCDVHPVGLDPDYGPVLGWTVAHPEDLAAPLQIEGSRHPTVLSNTVFLDGAGLFVDAFLKIKCYVG